MSGIETKPLKIIAIAFAIILVMLLVAAGWLVKNLTFGY
jgi:hypothetical protein